MHALLLAHMITNQSLFKSGNTAYKTRTTHVKHFKFSVLESWLTRV